MQVVLLAAGMGLRLGHLTSALPKAMLRMNGRPLIDYTLPRLLSNKKVEEVIVVGGFEFPSFHHYLMQKYSAFGDRLCILQNRDFVKGNLYTLRTAQEQLETSFLLCNVDHIYTAETWQRILQERNELSIFCDFLRPLFADDMKVSLDEKKYLIEMSKTLLEYDGGYVGLSYIPQAYLKPYKEFSDQAAQKFGDKAVVENVLPLMAAAGQKIETIPFDKERWYEVDTKEDLSKAEAAILDLAEAKAIDSLWR